MITISRFFITSFALIVAGCAYAGSGISDPECAITAEFGAAGASTDGMKMLAAAAGGNAKEVKALLNKGANANFADDELMTPLVWASRCGHLDVVKTLVEAGADVNLAVTYQKGMQYRFKNSSALIWAASNEHVEVVRFLLSKGADPKRHESVYELNAQGGERFVSEGREASDVTQNKSVLALLRK